MTAAPLLTDAAHRAFLWQDARRQVDFFRPSLRKDGTFAVLSADGTALSDGPQELHTTTRLVHSYALAKAAGEADCDAIIDAGMACLFRHHHDAQHGGWVWSFDGAGVADGVKLAYGHVFVLLAGSSAHLVGHPDGARLIAEATEVIETRYWDDAHGLLRDEYTRDWTPFSTYRGMNANMHGVEALLAAFEATGTRRYLDQAGRILDFFTRRIAPAHDWRIPEHYNDQWQIDAGYEGNPMFRPAGSTPGHSFELGRLLIQHWDLTGRADPTAPTRARALIEAALRDGWRQDKGGIAYTLNPATGAIARRDRYWWPVTEAIGALSALLKIDPQPQDAAWYARLWDFARAHFIDARHGGWFPEIDEDGHPDARQFLGKPDIYHALQADLIPLVPGVSRLIDGLRGVARG